MPAATDRQIDVGGDLAARVAALGTADAHRLRRRLQGAGRIDDDGRRENTLATIGRDVTAAEARLERRRASVPAVSYPDDLPVGRGGHGGTPPAGVGMRARDGPVSIVSARGHAGVPDPSGHATKP